MKESLFTSVTVQGGILNYILFSRRKPVILLFKEQTDERVVSFRWTCRNCSLASNITSSNLRPCDFKMGKVLNSLQTFKCIYNFDLR